MLMKATTLLTEVIIFFMYDSQTTTVARKFSTGELCVCEGGLDILNLTKPPLIYNVSYFNFGGLGVSFRGLSLPKPPVATGLAQTYFFHKTKFVTLEKNKLCSCF